MTLVELVALVILLTTTTWKVKHVDGETSAQRVPVREGVGRR